MLFLDEATIGLDVAMQRRIRSFIAEYNARTGACVMLTSHYMADVEALCRRVIVIHQGRLLYDGDLTGLVQRFAAHKTITVSSRRVRRWPDRCGWAGERGGDGTDRDRVHGPRSEAETPAVASRLLAALPIADLTIEEPPVDQVIEKVFAAPTRKQTGMAEMGLAPPDSRPELSRFSLPAVHLLPERFAVAVSANVAYRGAVSIWIFVTLIQPLVFIVVWKTVAGAGRPAASTANQFVAYFLVMMVVDHLTFIWHMWEFEWRIRTGAFSPLLMRPIHPIHGDVCENLAYKVLGLIGVLPAAVLIGVASTPTCPESS